MIELNIPGRGLVSLEYLVSDVNGTLAVDGQLIDGIPRILHALRDRLEIHLLTADTHGRQELIDRQLNLQAVRIRPAMKASKKPNMWNAWEPNMSWRWGKERMMLACLMQPLLVSVSYRPRE